MSRPILNIAASVLDRLRALSKNNGQPFDLLLTRYVLERLLSRLDRSDYRDRFALKGAVLMTTWFETPFRPTRDLDLLGFGDDAPDALVGAFKTICAIDAADGVAFDVDALAATRIREETDYGGLRLETFAYIARTRVKVSIDIAFGDATEPGLEELQMPVLLDMPAPHLRAYARETVIAEKFQAMVMLGRANTRMKDYYDIWMLTKAQEFPGDGLARAIAATFARRRTEIPREIPDGLSPEFGRDAAKIRQWEAFCRNIGIEPVNFEKMVAEIAGFLMLHAEAARHRAGE